MKTPAGESTGSPAAVETGTTVGSRRLLRILPGEPWPWAAVLQEGNAVHRESLMAMNGVTGSARYLP